MWSGTMFFYWCLRISKRGGVPPWLEALITESGGRVMSVCAESDQYKTDPSLYRSFSTPVGSCCSDTFKVSPVYHVCACLESRKALAKAWTRYYHEAAASDTPNGSETTVRHSVPCSTPGLVYFFQDACTLPSWLQSIIVTPLWVSLCTADTQLYSPQSLPLFCMPYPVQRTDSNEPDTYSTPRVLFVGARTTARGKRDKLRDAYDHEMLTAACSLMSISVVKRWEDADILLWCFSSKAAVFSNSVKTSSQVLLARRKILGLLAQAQVAQNLSIIHVEWLWQSYANGHLLPQSSYKLRLTTSLSHPSRPVFTYAALPPVDQGILEDLSLWRFCKERTSTTSRLKETKLCYASTVLPRLLEFSSLSDPFQDKSSGTCSLPFLAGKLSYPWDSRKTGLLRCSQSQRDALAFYLKKQLEREGFPELFPTSDSTVGWVISSSFPKLTYPVLFRLLSTVLGISRLYIGAPTTVTLLPLLADAVAKLNQSASSNALQQPGATMSYPHADALCLASTDASAISGSIAVLCGCALGCLSHGTEESSIVSQFPSFAKEATVAVVVVADADVATVARRIQEFYRLVSSEALERCLIHGGDAVSELIQKNSRIYQWAQTLAASLECFASPSQTVAEETVDGSTLLAQPAAPPIATDVSDCSEKTETPGCGRASWDVVLLSLGSAWHRWMTDAVHFENTELAYATLLDQLAAAEWTGNDNPKFQLRCLRVSLTDILLASSQPEKQSVVLEKSHAQLRNDQRSEPPSVKLHFKGCGEVEQWLQLEKKLNSTHQRQRVYQDLIQEDLRFKDLFSDANNVKVLHSSLTRTSCFRCPHT